MEITLTEEDINRILKQFDSYIKICCVNELRNLYKLKNRIRKIEVSGFGFIEIENMSIGEDDEIKIFDFIIEGNEIFIEDAILLNALWNIDKQERELILLKYFIVYSDEKLSEEMNMCSRTLTYQKNKIIEKVKKYMEGKK